VLRQDRHGREPVAVDALGASFDDDRREENVSDDAPDNDSDEGQLAGTRHAEAIHQIGFDRGWKRGLEQRPNGRRIAGLLVPLFMMRGVFARNDIDEPCPACGSDVHTTDATMRLDCPKCGKTLSVRDMHIYAEKQ
jgi:predicted RNA-binding Zn-ribbon protein involved in translation (DUF1610 family)